MVQLDGVTGALGKEVEDGCGQTSVSMSSGAIEDVAAYSRGWVEVARCYTGIVGQDGGFMVIIARCCVQQVEPKIARDFMQIRMGRLRQWCGRIRQVGMA